MVSCTFGNCEESKEDSVDLEYQLAVSSAVDRVKMVVDMFRVDSVTLLTSFGVQSGVMLALVAEACPEIRVLYIDTQGPTSKRDLEYGRHVLDILGLNNITVAKADVTREEFRQGMETIAPNGMHATHKVFHALSQDVFKITPLKQECVSSNVKCLLSGVRRGQTKERSHFKFLQRSPGDDPSKAHPILDWSDEQCLEFLRLKNVPSHPELSCILKEIRQAPCVNARPEATTGITSSLRSRRSSDRGTGMECGIHIQTAGHMPSKDPKPPLPNVVVGKTKCRFCVAAKKVLADLGITYVEVPFHLFPHLVPAGTKTVPVIYMHQELIGGYNDLCKYLGVEDNLNSK